MHGLAKLEPFSGLEPDWAMWRVRLDAIATDLGVDHLLEKAGKHVGEFDERF